MKQNLLLCFLLIFTFGLSISGCGREDEKNVDFFAAGEDFMRTRDYMEAENAYENYLRSEHAGPHRWESWNKLVDIAKDVRHNRSSVIELLALMRMEYEADPEKRRSIDARLADEYAQSGMRNKAIELWMGLVNDPETAATDKAKWYRRLSRVYLSQFEFEQVKETLALCLSLTVPDAEKNLCSYDLADAFMLMEDVDEGIAELRRLLEKSGVEEDLRVLAVFTLADAMEQKGNKEAAMQLFESIRSSYPNPRVIETRISYLKAQEKQSDKNN